MNYGQVALSSEVEIDQEDAETKKERNVITETCYHSQCE